MTKLLAFLTICVLVAFVSSSYGLKYDVEVAMSTQQQFQKVNATLNIALKSPNTGKISEFKWNTTQPLAPNTNHTNSIYYDYQIGQIKNMTFVFNATKLSNGSQRPVVYLKHVKLVPSYYPPGRFRVINTKYYCTRTPNTPIAHGNATPLVLCN